MNLVGRTCCECFGTGYHEHESMQAGKLASSTCETCEGCGRVVPLSTHWGAVEEAHRLRPIVAHIAGLVHQDEKGYSAVHLTLIENARRALAGGR